jgi:hypothetical protein
VIQNFFFEKIMSVEEQNMPLMHLTHTSESREDVSGYFGGQNSSSVRKSH